MKRFDSLLTLTTLCLAVSCGSHVKTDGDEKRFALVQFDVDAGLVPWPTDLYLDRTGDEPAVQVPVPCMESTMAKQARLSAGQLDGFGAYKPGLTFTLSDIPDPASLTGRIWVFCRKLGGVDQDPTAVAALDYSIASATTMRYDSDCYGLGNAHVVTVTPEDPLGEGSTCAVAVLTGITTEAGAPFDPSPLWYLVRQQENPVTLAEDGSGQVLANSTPYDSSSAEGRAAIGQVYDLWTRSEPLLSFLSVAIARHRDGADAPPISRSEFLLAWEFTTQTATWPLDPTQEGSPASALGVTADQLAGPPTVTAGSEFPAKLAEALGSDPWAPNPCDEDWFACDAVGSIVEGTFEAPNFQADEENPGNLDTPVPGAWDKALRASPDANVPTRQLRFLAFVPSAAPPANGYPVVVFGHGSPNRRQSLYYLASILADQGLASVAIDWVDHGERAVKISDEGACESASFMDKPACYADVFSSNLASTRDSIRQSVLDQLKLIRVLKACTGGSCGPLVVDSGRMGFLGYSYGGHLGTMVVAMSPDIKVSVLNACGVGWVELLTMQAPGRCRVIDLLIDSGILQGEKYGAGNPLALCMTEDWKSEQNFRDFSTLARWIFDPAEPANFTHRLRNRIAAGNAKVLVQEVSGDEGAPNSQTDLLATLLGLGVQSSEGLLPSAAALATTTSPAATPSAISGESGWLIYRVTGPTDSSPGNIFNHFSLLSPWSTQLAETLGARQMQTDTVGFFATNL